MTVQLCGVNSVFVPFDKSAVKCGQCLYTCVNQDDGGLFMCNCVPVTGSN